MTPIRPSKAEAKKLGFSLSPVFPIDPQGVFTVRVDLRSSSAGLEHALCWVLGIAIDGPSINAIYQALLDLVGEGLGPHSVLLSVCQVRGNTIHHPEDVFNGHGRPALVWTNASGLVAFVEQTDPKAGEELEPGQVYFIGPHTDVCILRPPEPDAVRQIIVIG